MKTNSANRRTLRPRRLRRARSPAGRRTRSRAANPRRSSRRTDACGRMAHCRVGRPTLPADARARISFDAARSAFNGSAGCNSLFGSYQADGASLKFGDTASTLMACEPALMKREQALSSALRRTAAYEFDNGALVFKNKQGKTLLKAVK